MSHKRHSSSSSNAISSHRLRTPTLTSRPTADSANSPTLPSSPSPFPDRGSTGAASGLEEAKGFPQPTPAKPATPPISMSLDSSPSPRPGGGWSSRALTPPSRNVRRSPSPSKRRAHFEDDPRGITWDSASAKSARLSGNPPVSSGLMGYVRSGLTSLSKYVPFSPTSRSWQEGQKRRFQHPSRITSFGDYVRRFVAVVWRHIWWCRVRLAVLLALILLITLFYVTRKTLSI